MKGTWIGKFLCVFFGMSMVGALFALDKVLYVMYPKPGPTTNVYPQEASTGFFIDLGLRAGLAALPDWRIVSEVPTNTNAMILYRLETTYTLVGPMSRPDCIYTYRLYGENNTLLFQTNVTMDIRHGMLDAVDVAVFGVGRALGQDLSRFAFVNLAIPIFDGEPYHLYLNRSKIADLTNTEPLSLRYRLMADEPYTVSLREPPSLRNLWTGFSVWQTNIALSQGQTADVAVQPMTMVRIPPMRTEIRFFPMGSYRLDVSSLARGTTNSITNISLVFRRETNLLLPLGRNYYFEVFHTPTRRVVSSDRVTLSQTNYTYQPVDKVQLRPFYTFFEAGVLAPLRTIQGIYSFPQVGGGFYHYLSMGQRIGLIGTFGYLIRIEQTYRAIGSVYGASARWGMYLFSRKYDAFRWYVEVSLGGQWSDIDIFMPDVPMAVEAARQDDLNRLMTGFIAEISTGIEIHSFSLGVGGWMAPRRGDAVGDVLVPGMSLFTRIIF